MQQNEPIYRLRQVTKIFADKNVQTTAVDHVDFDIYEGEIFGIIGMSGAGKSTLVRTLNRLEEVSEGEVIFDGKVLGDLSEKELRATRKEIAMIFQSFHLLNQKTVLDNVTLPLKLVGVGKKERNKRGLELLRIVGLTEKAKAYPAQLSGGQKQRVAIARALALQPKVLLCDEATSALDPKITEEILNLLESINRTMNLTIIMITHEMKVIEKICHRVAIIDHGSVAELGNVKEIFANPKSKAAQKLVLPTLMGDNPFDWNNECYRIVFNGFAATEPIIANLVQTTGENINILSANTRSVGGIAYGQMIVELPKEPQGRKRVLDYFAQIGITAVEADREVVV
ncbi:MAG: methionine ABC transporter ATP-binding protein [Agathobacter sp.]|uniref:methionine ABC transporter ATP-binding protein n=1 Tax=Agathobacter sp. TaxID=2021311 RepID=UPI00258CB015|nr:methionine ABC transporter ATP-binding protein [Agathobacter sp.]MCR5677224.1 methionine ABC transporter ATP-binding protein [Agathobacter sp.]